MYTKPINYFIGFFLVIYFLHVKVIFIINAPRRNVMNMKKNIDLLMDKVDQFSLVFKKENDLLDSHDFQHAVKIFSQQMRSLDDQHFGQTLSDLLEAFQSKKSPLTQESDVGYELKSAGRAKLTQLFYQDIKSSERLDILIKTITDFDKYSFTPAKIKHKM